MNPLLIASIKEHEGFRSKAYLDSVGVWTIGYGTNLQVLQITKEEADALMEKELLRIEGTLGGLVNTLDEVRRAVIVEMCYQLGVSGCLAFKKMWRAIEAGDYWAAASEMLDSKWGKVQTPKRAEKLAARMRHGTWTGLPE